MKPKGSILLYHMLLLTLFSAEAVKIGISKPLPMTTTQPPNTTTLETTTEEVITETPTTSKDFTTTTLKTTITTIKTTTTTTKPTNSEPEWLEFPPKKTTKQSNKTTSKKPSTTTITPTATTLTESSDVTNTTEKPVIATTSIIKWPSHSKYCFCDLNTDSCDINCCCDRDCSYEILKVFRCLKEESLDLEMLEGRFEDFKFQQGLPSCENNDGWLCVFRTNKPVIKDESSIIYSDTSHYYKWPNLLMEAEDIKNREFYKYGDLIKVINIETKEIFNFELPSSFKPPYCQIREPILHLKTFKRSCLITTNQKLNEIQKNILNLQKNYKIFIKPAIPEDLYNTKHMEIYIGNIAIRICYESLQSCLVYKNDLEIENAELIKVNVNILHNFTCIQGVVMDLWLKDTADLEEDFNKEYWLEYQVEFLNKTIKEMKQSQNSKKVNFKKKITSGSLGYLQGKPLILAKYIPFNKSLPLSSKNNVFNYFHVNNTESNTLSLFSKHQGFCKHFKNSQDLISFGINVAKQCKIRLENDTLLTEEPAKANFTRICLTLQDLINTQLFGNDINLADISSYFISQLGKPQNLSNKWLSLQVFNTDFNSVFGQYLEDTNTFVCRNILLSLSYEFQIATYMVDNVPLQNVLKQAILQLGERHDLEFALDENLGVPITLTVRFYDMHEKAVSAVYQLRVLYLEDLLIISLVLVFNI